MHYGSIKKCDIANGTGVRVSLFVSGCTNQCPQCFQPETWAFDYGQPFTEETLEQLLKLLAPSHVQGLTVLGGEPMEPSNQRGLIAVLSAVRKAYPNKTIWCFTGYLYEDILAGQGHPHCEVSEVLLALVDVLVDGRFVEELKDITLRFRGSSNQRVLDLNETRNTGAVSLWNG